MITSKHDADLEHKYSSGPYEWPLFDRNVAYWLSTKSNVSVLNYNIIVIPSNMHVIECFFHNLFFDQSHMLIFMLFLGSSGHQCFLHEIVRSVWALFRQYHINALTITPCQLTGFFNEIAYLVLAIIGVCRTLCDLQGLLSEIDNLYRVNRTELQLSS